MCIWRGVCDLSRLWREGHVEDGRRASNARLLVN